MVSQTNRFDGIDATAIKDTHGTPVAAYLRKSSSGKKKQEASIPDQKAAILKHCDARGWVVVAWYIDDGKSGSKNQHLRVNFNRMLADATNKPEWRGIVVWDFARFSRGNSLDTDAARTLHGAGIWLEATVEGRANWDTEMGRLQWAFTAEANHGYSVKLSAASTRGRSSALADGFWVHGRIPYAYDRLYVRDGLEPIRLPRTAEAGRPGGYRLKLVVNEAEAKLVVWMFQQLLAGKSLCWIAGELNKQGHATPYTSKHGWQDVTVRQCIQQPAYYGDIASKYSHVLKYNKGKWNRIVDQTKPNAAPPIIDRETWEAANRIMSKRAKRGGQTKNGEHRASGLLSGICRCGHCGYTLKKGERQQRVCASCGANVPRATLDGVCLSCGKPHGDKHRPAVYYYCATRGYYPSTATGQCRAHVVYEDRVLPVIRDRLMSRIEAEVLRQVLAKPADKPNADLDALKKASAATKAQVTTATRRMMSVPDDLLDEATEHLRNLKQELEAIEAQIRLAETTTSEAERQRVSGWLEDLKNEWVTLVGEERCIPVDLNQKCEFFQLSGADKKLARRMMKAQGTKSVKLNGMRVEEDEDEPGELLAVRITHTKTPVVTRPALVAHRDALRGLLEKLNVSVAIHWRQWGNGECPDFARISAKFDVPTGELGVDAYRYPLESSNGMRFGSGNTKTALSAPRPSRAGCGSPRPAPWPAPGTSGRSHNRTRRTPS